MFLLAVMMIAAGQQNATLKGHDEPQQISPEIFKAWENAGAKYGIIITNDFGHFRFRTDRTGAGGLLGSKVTDSGEKQLQKALPMCKIARDLETYIQVIDY
jgi:hypothetical protein